MQENNIQVFMANNLSDILYHIKTISNLQVVGNCTKIEKLPQKLLTTRGIKELSEISKKENYIEVGAAVTLNKLISLGENKMPIILFKALTKTATPKIRNLATLVGNICSEPKGTLFAPLLALDAKIIMQSKNETITIPITKFTTIPQGFFITKIRIPTDDWDILEFTKIGNYKKNIKDIEIKSTEKNILAKIFSTYSFLAKIENNTLTKIRIAFSSSISFRNTNTENRLVGIRLPIEKKAIPTFIAESEKQFDSIYKNSTNSFLQKQEFIRLLNYSLNKLT